ncbi:MAG: nitroreductase family protein [Bacteroidota bacterium]|jgi:SagB-type dehydrogenase family enzyme|uniref:nitroreductase family protein n=1 Tax=Mucilaginibacter lappiensis TaxID=354630 RepID=UPI003362168F
MSNPTPKSREDTVPMFAYPVKEKTKLQRPITGDHNADFFEIAMTRHSTHSFGALLPGQLDHLLWFAAKALETRVQSDGYVLSHRPSPSAGARHPIDILVCSNASQPTVAYYNPFEHSLNTLRLDLVVVTELVAHINTAVDMQQGVFLWLLAHPSRTAAKYEHPESLIWRDAGALLQQIQLTAIALKLSSCALGTLAEPFASQLFENIGSVVSAGGIIVGNLDL